MLHRVQAGSRDGRVRTFVASPAYLRGHTATAGHEAMSSITSSLLVELASAMTDEVEAIVAFDHGDTSTLAAWTREGCPAVHHLPPAMWWLMLGWVSPAR